MKKPQLTKKQTAARRKKKQHDFSSRLAQGVTLFAVVLGAIYVGLRIFNWARFFFG
jgi:hypothetical protein